tara:strand:- start:9 stop:821 length:813 start_codon:yes stop_codon:yes gene_type:complete
MNNAIIYCLCLHDKLYNNVKDLGYVPVGLGSKNFSDGWITDSSGENISHKNHNYGEHSFHYWFWKNQLDNIDDKSWVGFCAYRRFWQKNNIKLDSVTDFKNSVLKTIPREWENFDVILGDQMNLEKIKWIKVLKYGKQSIIRSPKAIFKNGRSIRFHFDMFHGNGLLDKAIKLLNDKDRHDFQKYVYERTSYNQGNMFICKSKKIMSSYYESIFEWLEKCESVFGFNLDGYNNIRIYAFLAERFLPYWFNKYAKVLEWPILFHDLNKENI